jgi:phosphoserine phosphatase
MTTTHLASWIDGKTRQAIEAFVADTTTEGSPSFIPVEERIAFFDNDGTLWPEHPMPIQLDFMIRRLAELADSDPSLRETQPYKASWEHDHAWFGEAMVKHYQGDDSDLGLLMHAMESAYDGVAVDDYAAAVAAFFESGIHPVLKRRYDTCAYAPMVELLRYLESVGYTTFIASGGDRDFMRVISQPFYGIPPERVVGSALKMKFHEEEDGVHVSYTGEMDVFDDGSEKPLRIWSRVGRRPVVAGGNSNGDIQMLRFANIPGRASLRILVRHDDAEREFAYERGAEEALARAGDRGWVVVSIKDDWTRVFAD